MNSVHPNNYYFKSPHEKLIYESLYNIKQHQKHKEIIQTKRKKMHLAHYSIVNKMHQTILKSKLKQFHNNNINNNNNLINIIPSSTLALSPQQKPSYLPSALSLNITHQISVNHRNHLQFVRSCNDISIYKSSIQELKQLTKHKEAFIKQQHASLDNELTNLKQKIDHITYVTIPQYNDYILYLKGVKVNERAVNNNLIQDRYALKTKVIKLNEKVETVTQKLKNILKYRNVLICLKEDINALPLKFNKPFHEWTNDEINEQTKYDKYLNSSFVIFESVEEFNYKLHNKEQFILTLYKQNEKLLSKIKHYKHLLQIEQRIYNDKKQNDTTIIERSSHILNDLKLNNELLKNKISKLYAMYNKKIKRNLKPHLDKIPFEYPPEVSMMILKLQSLYQIKNFKCDYAYMFYYIANMFYAYKKEGYLHNILNLSSLQLTSKTFDEYLNDLNNPDKTDLKKLIEETVVILSCLELTVNNMLIRHRKRMEDQGAIGMKLKELVEVNKKIKFVEKMRNQRLLVEEKMKQKRQILNEKYYRVMYRSHSDMFYNYRLKKDNNNSNNNDNNGNYTHNKIGIDFINDKICFNNEFYNYINYSASTKNSEKQK